jgi:DNA-binding HxlR family transcriptional regulator
MKHELRSECPIAASLDVIGDRWTLVILRDMLLGGSSRFSEFAVNESIASNILADRLRHLADGGLIEKCADPDDGRRAIYRPLAPAIALVPVLGELIAWGARHTAVPTNPAFELFANDATRRAAVADTMTALSRSVA